MNTVGTMDTELLELQNLTDPDRPITYGVVKPGPEDPSTGIIFIRGGDISNGLIDEEHLRTITQEVSRPYARTILRGGEVVISLVGNPGEVAVVPDRLAGANLARQAGLIALRPEIDAAYIKYYLMSPPGKAELFQRTQGAVQQVINLSDLKRVKVRLPSRQVQEGITDILSTYDDLIENNRRRIALLEAAARLLYREWFVHLRFPGHEHVTVTDSIPEGWERTTYSALFNFLCGFAFKSKTYLEEGKFGIVTIKNVHEAQFIPECLSRLDDVPEQMQEHCALAAGDILLSLTGHVGRACIVFGENYLLNQRVAKVVGNTGVPRSFTYWTFSNGTTQRELDNLAYGVAQLNLSPIKLGKRELLKPSPKVLDSFGKMADPMVQLITTLNLEIVQLSQARDLLLPRLMNREIVV